MRKFLVFLFLIFFVTCGPTESEIQQRIDAAVAEATLTSTSTTTQETTTSSTTTTTTTILEINKPYSDYYDKDSLHFLIYEIDDLISSDSYYIRFRAKWKELNSIRIHFDNTCVAYRQPNFENATNKSYLGIKIVDKNRNCFEANEVVAINAMGTNNKNVTFYNNGTYFNGGYSADYINNPKTYICCHEIDFINLNLIYEQLKETYYSNSTTTTTTTTTITTTTTSTTTTTTTTIYTDTEAPVWSNDPISFSKVNPTYLDILWGQANDNEGVAEFKIYANGNLVKIIPTASTNRTTITGLSPNTSYTFEILACDFNGNCSTNNPSATKKTSEGNSSSNSDSNNLSNVGPIPGYIVQLSELNGITESALCVYPFNGICNVVINSDGAQDFLPRLYFPQSYPDNCDTMQIKYSTNTGYNLYDTIFAHNSSTLYDLCFTMDKLIEIGYTYDALYGEEFLNSYGYAICDDWYLEEFTITFKNSTRLTYFRNGSVGYYEYYELKGVGTHNFNFSNFDFESVKYNNPGDPNWASRESSIVDCEY